MNTNEITRTVNRTTAAAIIGVRPDTLKHWTMQERGPQPAAKLGTTQQARVLYDVREIERWRADPTGYRWPSSQTTCRIKNTKHDERHDRRGR